MHPSLQEHLESQLSEKIKIVSPISGGDISNAHKIETAGQSYFVKSSANSKALEMYQAETKGLQQLAESKAIATPQVLCCEDFEGQAYLLMVFVDSKRPNDQDFEVLGRQLAQLHQTNAPSKFGNDHDNFIGNLTQSNTQYESWTEFYALERLLPQLKVALENKLLSQQQLPSIEKMIQQCGQLFGGVNPSLLHGDLWGGNYLISKDGNPYLIDPAVYIGHNEVDLAMTKLFSGFGDSFYSAYHELIPPHPNQFALNEIYQLYYLLVHLNLFGLSYLSSVLRILKKYFS